MTHLTGERIYHLAQLVTEELAFDDQAVKDMTHIGDCEECYRRLRAAMAMMDAVENASCVVPRKKARPQPERRRAELCLHVDGECTTLELWKVQSWEFTVTRERMVATLSGGMAVQCPCRKVAETADSGSFVECDPDSGAVLIRLAGGPGETPRASIVGRNGRTRPILLEKREGYFCGRLSLLSSGEYRLILEK